MTDSSLLGLTMFDACETAVVDEGDWTNDRVTKAAVRLQEGLSFLVQPTGLYQDANEYTGVRVLQPVPQADENEPPPMKRSELGRGEKIGLYLASVGFIVTTLCILLNALPLALLGMVLAAVGSSVYFVAHMKSVRGSNWEPLREIIEEDTAEDMSPCQPTDLYFAVGDFCRQHRQICGVCVALALAVTVYGTVVWGTVVGAKAAVAWAAGSGGCTVAMALGITAAEVQAEARSRAAEARE